MKLIKVGICGANGRMGQAIESLISTKLKQFEIVAKLNSSSQTSDLALAYNISDVMIDFSVPGNLKRITELSAEKSVPRIIGTTGLQPEHFEHINYAASKVAIIYAPNTSLGANLLEALSMMAAKVLDNYDIEILEAHHKHKKDSPSGTAIAIGKSIASVKKLDFNTHAVFDRVNKGLRKSDDISFSCIRGGGIFGEHQIIFASDNEIINIEHRALSRNAFAEGALYAASWIIGKKAGLYSMRDVLNLNNPNYKLEI